MLLRVSFDGAKLRIKFQTTKYSRNKNATQMHQKLNLTYKQEKVIKSYNMLYISSITLFYFEIFFFCFWLPNLYFVGFYVLLLFDVVLSIQVDNLTAITQSEQTMAAYLQNSFFSAGYLMAASIVALKCLNLVPDLAAWMIPEGDTAFSTRNFGEGVAQQAKMSAQGVIGKVL